MFSQSFFDRIPSKRGRALYAIACGEHSTKLDVKERAGLSMSTVIASVETLRREGLITVSERRVATGGKPHSVIDVSPNKCVCGVAFRAGALYGAALDLGGRVIARRSLTPSEGVSPFLAVSTLLSRLSESSPPPLILGLALNVADREEMIARLSEEQGVEVLPSSGVLSLAYRALWRGSPYPLAVIGVGNHVKCALLDGGSCRSVDLSELTLSPTFAASGTGTASLLSSSRVCHVLREKCFGGHFSAIACDFRECRDLSDYSSLLVRAFSGVIEAVNAFAAPREIRLFCEYVTPAFFDRIRSALGSLPLVREEADGSELAVGAAIAALTERVFS